VPFPTCHGLWCAGGPLKGLLTWGHPYCPTGCQPHSAQPAPYLQYKPELAGKTPWLSGWNPGLLGCLLGPGPPLTHQLPISGWLVPHLDLCGADLLISSLERRTLSLGGVASTPSSAVPQMGGAWAGSLSSLRKCSLGIRLACSMTLDGTICMASSPRDILCLVVLLLACCSFSRWQL
jgi:hypothetical protein